MRRKSVEVPEALLREIDLLVQEGWFASTAEVVEQALRRFLDAHRPEQMAAFIREDVEWGLHGRP